MMRAYCWVILWLFAIHFEDCFYQGKGYHVMANIQSKPNVLTLWYELNNNTHPIDPHIWNLHVTKSGKHEAWSMPRFKGSCMYNQTHRGTRPLQFPLLVEVWELLVTNHSPSSFVPLLVNLEMTSHDKRDLPYLF